MPRVPWYSGTRPAAPTAPCAYRTLTVSGGPSQALRLGAMGMFVRGGPPLRRRPVWPYNPARTPLPGPRRFGLLPFRSPLLRESRLMSRPRGTEMFQFPRCPSSRLSDSALDVAARTTTGCPIRVRQAHRSLAAPLARFAALRALLRPLAPQASTRDPSPLGIFHFRAFVISSRCHIQRHKWRTSRQASRASTVVVLRPKASRRRRAILLVRFGKIEVIHHMRLSRCAEPSGSTTEE
jgi:hypothetical protein